MHIPNENFIILNKYLNKNILKTINNREELFLTFIFHL